MVREGFLEEGERQAWHLIGWHLSQEECGSRMQEETVGCPAEPRNKEGAGAGGARVLGVPFLA